MKLRNTVPGLAMAVVVAACVAAPAPVPGSPTPTVPPQAGPVEMVERDGVRVTLAVELAELPIGGRSWVTVTIENRGAQVALWQGGGCEVPASVSIKVAAPVRPDPGREWAGIAAQFKNLVWFPGEATDTASFNDQRFLDAGRMLACPANLAINELDPGERIEHRAAWDGDVNGAVPPPGLATVTAAFPYLGPKRPGADPFSAPLQAIEVSAAVVVVDRGVGLVSPGQAVDAALSHERFAARVAALPMEQWQGVELRWEADGYVVVHTLLENGQPIEARVTVNRHTGELVDYVELPRQIQ